MNINLKKHLKIELLIAIIASFLMYEIAYNIHVFIHFFCACFIVGAFNTFYLFAKLINQRKFNTVPLVIIFLFTFGLQWCFFSFFALPLILFEIIYICIGNTYIGRNSAELNKEYNRRNHPIFDNDKIAELYNEFISVYRFKSIAKTITVIIAIISIYFISKLAIADYLIDLIGWLFIIICFIAYNIIKMRINTKASSIIDPVLLDECDGLSYYQIYKILNAKFPQELAILQCFTVALRVSQDDVLELKELLQKNERYKKHIFYLSSLIDIVDLEDKQETFDKFYNKAYPLNVKLYNKTGRVEWDNNIKFMNIEKLILDNRYMEALEICEIVQDENTKYNLVRKAFFKGICFMNLNKTEDAISEFNYVEKNGNTLRMKQQAKKYLDDLNTKII